MMMKMTDHSFEGHQVHLELGVTGLRLVQSQQKLPAAVDWEAEGLAIVGPGWLFITVSHDPSLAWPLRILDANSEILILIGISCLDIDQELSLEGIELFGDN